LFWFAENFEQEEWVEKVVSLVLLALHLLLVALSTLKPQDLHLLLVKRLLLPKLLVNLRLLVLIPIKSPEYFLNLFLLAPQAKPPATPDPKASAPAPQSSGPSLLGNFASSMAGSVAGSVIGHSVANMISGSGSSEAVNEQPVQQV
jgi:hypothetical protein